MKAERALKKNLVSNVVLFLLNGVNSLVLPPFLVRKLGVAAYGLIPLSIAMVNYASIVTVGINGSVSRFLAIDLANKDDLAANRTFNTAFFGMLALLTLVAPAFLYISVNIADVINVPVSSFTEARHLFLYSSVSFICIALASVFNSSAYVANRLDLVNRVSVMNVYIRLLLVLAIFLLVKVSLSAYGFSTLIAGLVALGYSYFLFRRYTPDINLGLRFFSKPALKGLLGMGGWLVIIQLGAVLFLQIDLLVINKMLGPEAAGRYGVILQWSTMIRTFAVTLSGATGPAILTLYAQRNTDEIVKLTRVSNKMLTLFITCIVGTLIVVSGPLLKVWLGNGFVDLKWLLVLLLAPLPLNLGVLPLFSVNRAYNKVKMPGLFTCIMGVINFLLAVALLKFTTLGLYSVAIASAVVLTAKNFVFMPIYTAKTMGLSWSTFFSASTSSVVILAISFLILFFREAIWFPESWIEIAVCGAGVFAILFFCSFFCLSKKERRKFTDVLSKNKLVAKWAKNF